MSAPEIVNRRDHVTSIRITPFTLADLDEAVALWRISEGITVREVDAPPAIARYLDRNPGLSFVARDGDRLVGTALCGHDGRRGYLQHVAVASTHRQLGVGRALVERCVAALRDVGIEKCHLMVLPENVGGRAFWRRMGWIERGDIVLMSRTLSNSANA